MDITNRNISKQNWFFFSKRMTRERRIKITQYAERFFEPVLEQFPELKGKVHLLLRKNGWFADYKPVLNITIREESLENASEWRIRSTTAHELLHLIQFINNIGLDRNKNNKKIEQQATFLTFARGFAYDYVKTFPVECKNEICNHQFKYSYFYCSKIFVDCCKHYTEEKLRLISAKLENLASNYCLNDNPDYDSLLYSCLIEDN